MNLILTQVVVSKEYERVKMQFHGPSGLTNSIRGVQGCDVRGTGGSARVKRLFILVRLAGLVLYRYGVILEATNDGFRALY